VKETTNQSTRLHYLDWLQVLAILGVFLFHAILQFDTLSDRHIKNVEKSTLVTFLSPFLFPWGKPFFLMAGATSWFSLRQRTAGYYLRERVICLLIPFIVGAIILTPIHANYELTHKGWWDGDSLIKFILSSEALTIFYTEYNSLTPVLSQPISTQRYAKQIPEDEEILKARVI